MRTQFNSYTRVSKDDPRFLTCLLASFNGLTRRYIAKCMGVKERQVSNLTSGYYKKYKYGWYNDQYTKETVYCVARPKKDYVLVANAFEFSSKWTADEKDWFNFLATICLMDTLMIKWPVESIAACWGVCVKTAQHRLDVLRRKGLIAITAEGIKILKYVKPVKKNYLNKTYRKMINDVMMHPDNSRVFKQIVWFLQNNLQTLPWANKIFDSIVGGYCGLKTSKIVSADYDFAF